MILQTTPFQLISARPDVPEDLAVTARRTLVQNATSSVTAGLA